MELEELLLNEKDIIALREKIRDYHPYDLANIFVSLSKEARYRLYEILDTKEMADIFEYLDDPTPYVDEMTKEYAASVIDNMEVDDAADMLSDLDDQNKNEYLDLMSQESREELNSLIAYDENEAGSIMTTNYLSIDSNIDVKEAMKILVSKANETEVINPLFVTSNDKLIGTLQLNDLIIARTPNKISEIMDVNIVYVYDTDSIIDASYKIKDYALYALPVVNENLEIKGIITMDDAIDVIEDETNEDYAKMASLSDDDTSGKLFKTLKHRLPWLLILAILSFIVSTVMNQFMGVIESVTVLVFFQTLILDMAGNTGTQSLAVTVRGISKGDFENKKDVFKHIFKEFRIGLLNGLFLGTFAFLITVVFLIISKYSDYNIYFIAFSVGISMMIVLLVSNVIGSFLPLLFNKIHIDPAVASGPFISTLTDALSILIYFAIAKAIIIGM